MMEQQGPVRIQQASVVPHGVYPYRSDSVVRLNNGKLLYMYCTGTHVRQAFMPTGEIDDLLVDGSVLDTATLDEIVNLNVDAVNGRVDIGATAFRNEYGLFYFCARQTDRWEYLFDNGGNIIEGGGRELSVELYKSASGNADDWTLHSVVDFVRIEHYTDISIGLGLNYGSCGLPYVTPSGAMVVASAVPATYSVNGIGWRCGVYRSTDQGASWTRQANYGVGIVGGAYLRSVSRNIFARTLSNGTHRMVMTFGGQYVSAEGYIAYSDDDGVSWTLSENLGLPYLYQIYDEVDDFHYLISGRDEGNWSGANIRQNFAASFVQPVLGEPIEMPDGFPQQNNIFMSGDGDIGAIQQLVTTYPPFGDPIHEGLLMWQGRIMRSGEVMTPPTTTPTGPEQTLEVIGDLSMMAKQLRFKAPAKGGG